MNNDIDYHVKSIARKLLSLKSTGRLNRADRETIAEIIDTDIPLIQTILKDDAKAK